MGIFRKRSGDKIFANSPVTDTVEFESQQSLDQWQMTFDNPLD